jgi:ribosomal protein S18 acetylase RimI-like enzyme
MDAEALTALAEARGWHGDTAAWRVALSLGGGLGVEPLGGGLAAAAILVTHGPAKAVLSVLVAPEHGGQGIGRRLAGALLERAGGRTVELHAPPAGVPFAAALGFQPAGGATRFAGRTTAGPRPEGGAGLRAVSGSDFPAVVAIDEVAFGSLRRPLLEALFPMAARACLAVAGGRTVGYGLSWEEGAGLGVGPIVAEDELIGASMAAWLAGTGEREVRIDVPEERTTTAETALAMGLTARGRIARMVRGGGGAAGRRERLHALAAPWAG